MTAFSLVRWNKTIIDSFEITITTSNYRNDIFQLFDELRKNYGEDVKLQGHNFSYIKNREHWYQVDVSFEFLKENFDFLNAPAALNPEFFEIIKTKQLAENK